LEQWGQATTTPALLPSTLALILKNTNYPFGDSLLHVRHALFAFQTLQAPRQWDACHSAFSILTDFVTRKLEINYYLIPAITLPGELGTASGGALAIIDFLEIVSEYASKRPNGRELQSAVQQLYSDVVASAPQGTVRPGRMFEQTVMALHSNAISHHGWSSRQAAIAHVLLRSDYTSWWSADLGVATRAFLHAMVGSRNESALELLLPHITSPTCTSIAQYLQRNYGNRHAAVLGSRQPPRSLDGRYTFRMAHLFRVLPSRHMVYCKARSRYRHPPLPASAR
jgi:hypothetical protein